MKNKKLNRLLVPAVLLIWLGVIFRWESAGEVRAIQPQAFADFAFQEDSLLHIPALTLAYRDPFLERPFYANQKTKGKSFVPEVVHQAILSKDLPRQKITYKGAVETDGNMIALVEVVDELFYLKANEEVANWTCQKIDWDQLILVRKGHKISIVTGKDTLL
jgi:hypothetical protein